MKLCVTEPDFLEKQSFLYSIRVFWFLLTLFFNGNWYDLFCSCANPVFGENSVSDIWAKLPQHIWLQFFKISCISRTNWWSCLIFWSRYKFMKIKCWLKRFWVGIVENGSGILKNESQNWINKIKLIISWLNSKVCYISRMNLWIELWITLYLCLFKYRGSFVDLHALYLFVRLFAQQY